MKTDLERTAANLAKNRLLLDCYQHMQSGDLAIPTLPDIAFKIRRVINDEKSDITSISRVVQLDLSITARLIQIANSSLYSGRKKIESCPEALTRLGVKTTQEIITAIALKSVFKANSALISQKMSELWAHSSYIAAISAVFAHKIPGFDPDRAMLAGLIHDIGIVPVLTYADNHPGIIDHPHDLVETVRRLRIDIGVQIIQSWDFPDDFQSVIAHSENWFRKNQEPVDYSDIVMIAQLHSFIGKVDIKRLPKIEQLPVYKKIASHLDVDDSLSILDAARDEINQIHQLLA